MNEFYESILNIRSYDKEKVLSEVNEIVIEELEEVMSYVSSLEGLCKVLANNLKIRLENLNIKVNKVNLNNLGSSVDHEFLIATFKDTDNKVNYILLDPTYRQFLGSKGVPINFKSYPAETLKNSNLELLNRLLDYGFSIIDENSFSNYLNSFEIDYKLDEIIKDNYKEEYNETTIKNHKK